MTGHDPLASRRRVLQLGLGLFWLLDAALQYQPYMFTSAFSREVLAPSGDGNPAWVAGPVHWSAHLTAGNVVLWNAVFATVQLLIALGLFTRATVKVALVGSVLWGLGVWWLGEGLGGLLAAPQSPIMGAPGAALLYALISVLLWPPSDAGRSTDDRAPSSVATTGLARGLLPRVLWLLLWGSFAFESLQSMNRAPSALHDLIAGMQEGEPGWLAAVNRGVAGPLAHHGTSISIALAVVFAAIGLAVFAVDRIFRVGIVVAIVLAAVIWVVAQDLGEIATGQATDPNTAPLIALLAITYWPARPRGTRPRSATVHESADSASMPARRAFVASS